MKSRAQSISNESVPGTDSLLASCSFEPGGDLFTVTHPHVASEREDWPVDTRGHCQRSGVGHTAVFHATATATAPWPGAAGLRAAGREDPALLLGGGLVGDTTNDGSPDTDVLECDRINFVGVLVQDGEVGELAGLDAADEMVHLDLMGAAERDGV